MKMNKNKEEKTDYVKASTVEKIAGDNDIIILLGERSNGKSFAVKELLIKRAYKHGEQFGYLRRYNEDTKDYLVGEYFSDVIKNKNGHEYIKEWTDGHYTTITAFRKSIYFANVDPETEKVLRGPKIGRMFGLSNAEHYKSLSFPEIKNIVYEEFVTNSYYLQGQGGEPKLLLNFLSTVFRHERGHLYCIGNKVSRINPYFGEWQLTNIPKQKVNSVDIYRVKNEDTETKIAVYMTHTMKINSGMFFGNAAKAITGGEWETDEQPHLAGHRDDYNLIYTTVFKYDRTTFLMEFLQSRINPNDFTWYVTPKTTAIQKDTRIVANSYHLSNLCTIGFVPLTKNEQAIFSMLKQGKVCFSDNLTGTEFKQCYNMLGAM